MSAPPKPWERGGIGGKAPNSPLPCCRSNPSSAKNSSSFVGRPELQTSASRPALAPPPVPARPQAQRTTYNPGYNTYGGYSGMSNYGMGNGMYGSYGMYGMGGYGYGINRYGMNNNPAGTSNFVRRAEESSQAAFQSIESLVQAFGSISMMLESTYFAVTNSFHAVLGVADHFSRLRSHLLKILGVRAIYRTIKYIVQKVLVLLRLREHSSIQEDIWHDAGMAVANPGAPKKPSGSWPIIMFFAVVLGTPWLIWKFLQSVAGDFEESDRNWMSGNGDHVIARADYDFQGEGEEELSFCRGDVLKLAPKDKQPRIRGWLLGTVDGNNKGLVPANYVKILGLKRGTMSGARTVSGPSQSGTSQNREPPANEPDCGSKDPPSMSHEESLSRVFSESQVNEQCVPDENLQVTSEQEVDQQTDVQWEFGDDLQDISKE